MTAALRTLTGLRRAARNQQLDILPTLMDELVCVCPCCQAGGRRQLCRITISHGYPTASCQGCTKWSDDESAILAMLGYDPDADEPHEIPLQIFNLLWAIERAERRAVAA